LQELHSNLNVYASMTREAGTIWMGLRGYFTEGIVGHLVPEIEKRRVHVCGPPGMMDAMVEILRGLGVPDEQVKTEAFGPAKKPVAQPATPVEGGETEATKVTFKTSGKSVPLPAGQTVLDAAEGIGVDIDNSCRSGQCGLCKVKLLSGKVSMECDDALSEEDKAGGLILACQAVAVEPITVEE
ncbi:MAG: 2Fe-2S iron-sulfur cluster binding domain-containing protein, partial [Akkermansiaceae bacterium]|nr:2Fe-2S iron-sulfur cluster binding domain-containing protein [Akkermansiaceae bacterium]